MKNSVLTQLSALPNMDTDELESLWRNNFDNDPPPHKNPALMRRKLAWRIQELAYGGLAKDAQTRLKKLRQNPEYKSRQRKKAPPPVGAQYVRYWRGEEHRVMVLADGFFEYKGCKYKSLTAIATLITGTKRSGPAFFTPQDNGQSNEEEAA